jgi:hypothetical protein
MKNWSEGRAFLAAIFASGTALIGMFGVASVIRHGQSSISIPAFATSAQAAIKPPEVLKRVDAVYPSGQLQIRDTLSRARDLNYLTDSRVVATNGERCLWRLPYWCEHLHKSTY